MRRLIQEEWLDQLPAEDAGALRSRTDLRRLNRLMNHVGIVKGLLRRVALPPGGHTLADLGGGDGSFALRLAAELRSCFALSAVTLVDRNAGLLPGVQSKFVALGCELNVVGQDVFAWLRRAPPFTIVLANLFLHHFNGEALRELFGLIADRARVFVACEPRRSWLAWAGSHTLAAIGCNSVTRHDAKISVRAGFTARELSSFWPRQGGWTLQERPAGMFSHAFLASRGGGACRPVAQPA
jgi:2-polyprenyl-3-methyl-5-hydroxy-6-metoxy-1,4-benzoquinol methylase